ncbi:hypothetical protein ACS0TY_032809 [Phlomoides rotata]
MKKLLPSTDLVAYPHINSKIHMWKKEYGSLFDLLSKSGIGWNCTTTIDVFDEAAWENQKRLHMDPDEKVSENKSSLHEIPEHVAETTSVCKPLELGSKKSKGTKRKLGEAEIYVLADRLGDFIQSSDSTFNNLAQRFDNEHEAKASQTSLYEIMNKVPGLKLHDKLKAADELVQNTNRLELFMSLPEEEQHEYVWMLLDVRL